MEYEELMLDEQDVDFDRTIGQLDFVLSKLMIYSKQAKDNKLSEPNRQTLKHHAEDMEAAAKAIYKRLGIEQEGTPQLDKPSTTKLTFCSLCLCEDCQGGCFRD